MVTRRLDRDGITDTDSRALVRRTGGDDAESRRPIRVSSRSILAAVGIPLRLDAFSCDSDRHNCGGRSWICTLQRRACVVGFGKQLHYLARQVWRICVVAFDGTARGPSTHWISDIHEHARIGDWQAYSKRLYDCKDWRAASANRARNHNRIEIWCRRGKLQGLLDGAGGSARRRRRFNRCGRIRAFRRNLRRTDELLVLCRRMEQHHFYRGRGSQSAAQRAAFTRIGYVSGDRALFARKYRLPSDAAVQRNPERAQRSRRLRNGECDFSGRRRDNHGDRDHDLDVRLQ